jgi:LemA protein
MVSQDQAVKKAWSVVEADYQRRSKLIVDLVNTVKGAANFEQETLTKVIEERAKATQPSINPGELTPENIAKFQQAQGELSGAFSRFSVIIEKYPELKATDNFKNLQAQLESTENRIKTSRKDFSDAVEIYNTTIKVFPNNIFANIFGFHERQYFTADPGAEKGPTVDFKN